MGIAYKVSENPKVKFCLCLEVARGNLAPPFPFVARAILGAEKLHFPKGNPNSAQGRFGVLAIPEFLRQNKNSERFQIPERKILWLR